MPKRKQSKLQKNTKIIFFITTVFLCLFISIAPQFKLSLNIPSWSDLFSEAGLRSNSLAQKQPLSIHFIDVGQGDCIFINAEQGNILIDAGERGNSDTVIRYLRNFNVSTLDYIIVTHPDSDHIGSMPEVIEAFDVRKIVMPYIIKKNIPTTKIFEKLLYVIKSSGAKVIAATPGDKYDIGDVKITALGPVSQNEDLNNMSVVIRVELGKTSFLLAGDAEMEEELDIIKNGDTLKSDVLKAGHHGSKSSSSYEFLKAVLPHYVIISCGKENSYGHPNTEALDRFRFIGAEVFRTDKVGTIILGSNGNEITAYLED